MMIGPAGESPVERFVAEGRAAAAWDALQTLAAAPLVERIIVATPDRSWAQASMAADFTLDLDRAGEPFHFGRRLAELCQRYTLGRIFYLGGGSLPLLGREALAEVLSEIADAPAPRAVTNNLFSSDWLALSTAGPLTRLAERLPRDNALGWVLKTEAGITVRSLEPSAGTRVDIDTPFDLMLLSLHPQLSGKLLDYLSGAARQFDTARLRAAISVLGTPGSQVALLGRVASAAWAHLEAHTQVWLRVYSEERGMAASGRQAAGRARSLVAAHVAAVGEARFFAELAEMAGAAVIDTRPLLAHHGLWPPPADRYASDLGRWELVGDPLLRRFTQAAVEASIPVVLGGHGAVAGGLYALVEILQGGTRGGG